MDSGRRWINVTVWMSKHRSHQIVQVSPSHGGAPFPQAVNSCLPLLILSSCSCPLRRNLAFLNACECSIRVDFFVPMKRINKVSPRQAERRQPDPRRAPETDRPEWRSRGAPEGASGCTVYKVWQHTHAHKKYFKGAFQSFSDLSPLAEIAPIFYKCCC